jgi:hypothetical protein
MKRLWISFLLCLVAGSVALARPPKPTPVSPVFINDKPIVPPTVPPQVDALMFINRSDFVVSNDFLIPSLFLAPYEAQSVLIWSNDNRMVGLPGFRFDNTPNPAHLTSRQRHRKGALLSRPSLIFENSGEISATTWLEVNANHVVNPGILSGDINARVRILAEHGFADLSRGAVRTGDLPQPDCTSVSNLFFGPFFFGLLDPEVIEDYNFINFGISGVVLSNRLNIPVPLFLPSLNTQFAPPNPIAPPAQYAALVSIYAGAPATNRVTNTQFTVTSCGLSNFNAFVHVQTNGFFDPFTGQFITFGRDISVVLVPTNGFSTNISVGVSFPTNNGFFGFFFGNAPIVEFRAETFDVIDQRLKTNFLTFRDDGNFVFRAHDCDFDLGEPANASYTPDLFFNTSFTTNQVNYNYTVSSVHVGNTNSIFFTNVLGTQFLFFPELGQSPAASDPTNLPGNIEIIAKDLDLSHTRIRSENGILIHATNLIGNDSAFLDAPFLSFDVGTTNQNLVISNLLSKQVSRLVADLNSWAADWSVNVTNSFFTNIVVNPTNGTTVTNITGTTEPWNYHVLILGACINDSEPSITHRFVLHGTNMVIEDQLAINAALTLEGRSLTLGSNASLTLPRNTELAFTNLQGVIDFTNNGVVNVTYGAYFGDFVDGYVPPPQKKKKRKLKGPQPPRLLTYESFVNHGTIDATTVKVRSGYIENSGTPFFPATILGSNGPVSLEGTTVVLSNSLVDAQTDLRLTAADLLVTHTVLRAGETNGSNFRNFIPGALIIDGTNSLTDGGTNANNVWRTTAGVRMLRRPTPLTEDGVVGDLLGTRIESFGSTFGQVIHTWAGEDRGPTVEGFANNLALGRLVLDGTLANVFRFKSSTTNNALYVDFLELRNDATNYNFSIGVDPDFTIYIADSNIRPDKLEEKSGGRVRWVSDFIGPQSTTNITYPNGITYTFNGALARNQDLDSDGDGVLNSDDCTPIIPPGLEDQPQFWFGALCPSPSPLRAIHAADVATENLNLNIALSAEGREVVLSWDAAANSVNSVEFAESLTSGTWQVLTNFINGPVNARVTVKDAAAAPQRVYRVRVDAGKP